MSSDASLNVCTNISYLNSIDQKRRFQIFNIPPVRYNNLAKERNPYLQINPDTSQNFTKFQLDMRRKSEVLKYSSNRMSTQTNNLTRAERFVQAVNGSYQQRTFSQEFIENNTNNGVLTVCPPGTIIKTPTTSSDVPGPPMLLYEDPAIPLYQFINETLNAPYGLINQESDPYPLGFNYVNKSNINTDEDSPPIFTLYFLNVSSNYYTLSFTTPVSISFTSNYLQGITSPFSSGDYIDIAINSISLSAVYSYSQVTFIIPPMYTLLYNTVIRVNVTNNNVSSFSGTCYFNTVTFSNIIIPSQVGYIYDFKLIINYNVIPNDVYTQNYNTPTITTFLNATTPVTPSTANCSLSNNPSIGAFPPLSVTGSARE